VAEGVGRQQRPAAPAGQPGLDKPIYTISVASEILETHPRTLMMYENMGLVVPQRTATNRRRYSQRDVYKLQTIQNLTRNHGVNLTGVRYVLTLMKLLHEHGVQPPEGLRDIDVSQLETPCFVTDLGALEANLRILADVQVRELEVPASV